jgi:shikimate dehydrogenase
MNRIIIKGSTQVCGIIGDPVAHSISPVMQNAAFEHTGLDFAYIPFNVKPDNLDGAIKGLCALGVRGFNVTVPHKINVIPLLDEVDELALKIGAVNTVVNNGGILKGYNTDAQGFIQVLTEKAVQLRGKRVAVLGAGGAARAVVFGLAKNGANITVFNRSEHLQRAADLAINVQHVFGREVRALEYNDLNLEAVLNNIEILVNATSAGMFPNVDESPVNRFFLHRGLLVFDIVYNPVKTRLLMDAEAVGANTINGLEMLVQQGALSFQKWTGFPAPVAVMRKAVMEAMKNEQH